MNQLGRNTVQVCGQFPCSENISAKGGPLGPVFTRYIGEEGRLQPSVHKGEKMTGILLSIIAIFGFPGGPEDFGDSCSVS